MSYDRLPASFVRNKIAIDFQLTTEEESYNKIKQLNQDPRLRNNPNWKYFLVRFLRKEGKTLQKMVSSAKFYLEQFHQLIKNYGNTEQKYKKKNSTSTDIV